MISNHDIVVKSGENKTLCHVGVAVENSFTLPHRNPL